MSETTSNPETRYQPVMLDVEPYVSRDYIEFERDRLWRKVWLQAGRLEEIPNVGDFMTYEVLDDSILIVRESADKINAFHNVCVHRGRRLVDIPEGARNATGNRSNFICGYHGWNYGLDGEARNIACMQDWQGTLTPEITRLPDVRVDTWGGWVWINMNPDCEPLRDYLEPAATVLDHFELQNLRFKWRRWGVFECNWKVAIEAFIETYHVPATHPEYMRFGIYNGWGHKEGLHSSLGYDAKGENKGRIRLGSGYDARKATAEMVSYTMKHVDSNFSQSLLDAAMRLEHELPENATEDEVLKHWVSSARAADAKRGVVWPVVAPELVARSGTAWNIFPNFRLGHAVNNALCYHARPYGDDPDTCYFEVTVFELYPEGEAPKTDWIYTPLGDPGWGSVLSQDFSNMAAVQKGMKSFGFKGPRPNPKEEGAVNVLHEVLADYIGIGKPRPV